jgi:hypothetical protein
MIIALLIISTLGMFISFVFADKVWKWALACLFFIVFVGSIVFSVANTEYHFGMEKASTTKTTSIVSSADSSQGMNMLLYQGLGTDGKETVYIYKTSEKQKKVSTTKADVTVTNKVETGASKAQKVTKTTRWVYKNDGLKFLFGIYGNNNEYIKQTNTFKIPDSWVHLSTTQAKKLAKLAKTAQKEQATPEAQAAAKQAATAYIKAGLTKLMTANPKMTAEEQAAATKKLTAEFTAKAKADAMAKLIAEAKK